ncbi:MAG: Cobalamin-binding protein precursor [Methanomassiliicoccales archaeon PtaB.Bin215]|nr:MAG: Cobalamin-binding protein precursor [Methanomassiliicoccales archaeon PtaB.Bin215]
MNKKALATLLVVAVLVVASAAAALIFLNKDASDGGTTGTISFVDDRGKTVNLSSAPQRIISLGSAFTEIIFDLDAQDRVVAVDKSSMWLVENNTGTENITNLQSVSSLSVESIMNQNPDLVVIWNFNMYSTFISNMENAGITVATFYPKNVSSILDTIKVLGKAIGEESKALEMVSDMQDRIDAVLEKTSDLTESERPKVYLELATGGGKTVGNGTMSNDLIEMAGGLNIFNNGTGNWLASSESIVEKNPDIIIIEDSSSKTNDGLKTALGSTVTAVSGDKIYRIDGTTLTTSPSVVDALENMAKWFHPELFP